jgi:leucyl-tRNA synthetase
MVDKSGDMPRL